MATKEVIPERIKNAGVEVGFLLLLLSATWQCLPIWFSPDNNTYHHQPLVLVFLLFFLWKNRPHWSVDLAGGRDLSLESAILFFLASYGFALCLINRLVFFYYLTFPLLVGATFWYLGAGISKRDQVFLVLMLALMFPEPWPFQPFFPGYLALASMKISRWFLAFFDPAANVDQANYAVFAFSQSLKIGGGCSGFNSLMTMWPIILMTGYYGHLSGRIQAGFLVSAPIFTAFFNALRIVSMFVASKWIPFATAVSYFHSVGFLFFLPNLFVTLWLMDRFASGKPGIRQCS